jgi:hypothetical protein
MHKNCPQRKSSHKDNEMLPSHGKPVSYQSISDSSADMSGLLVCWFADVEISLPDLIFARSVRLSGKIRGRPKHLILIPRDNLSHVRQDSLPRDPRSTNQEELLGCGPDNLDGMHLQFTLEAERRTFVFDFNLPKRYTGPPGQCHGGIIATILDDAMGKGNKLRNVVSVRHENLGIRSVSVPDPKSRSALELLLLRRL